MPKEFNNPQELIDAYGNGFKGAKCDPVHLAKLLASLPMPKFSTAGLMLRNTGSGKLSLPYKSVIKLSKDTAYKERQICGDCVSHGSRNAVDLTRAVQIDTKHTMEGFDTVGATEAIYGSRNNGGEGMSCSTAAEFVHSRGGVILRKNYPGVYDLTQYKGDIGWGSRGIPANVIELCKQHPVKTITQINNINEARDALANGYGIAVCSNQGFSAQRDDKGFCRPQGNWGHCELPGALISGQRIQKIENVMIGDKVYGHDGKEHRVTRLFSRNYSGQIVTFKTKGLHKQSVTAEHPLLVFREMSDDIVVSPHSSDTLVLDKTKTKQLIWIKASDLKVGDLMVCPHIEYSQDFEPLVWKYITRKCKNIPNDILLPDSDIAWLFGLYAANGNIVENHKVVITINSNKETTINRAKLAFEKLGNFDAHIKNFGTFVRITVYSAILARNFVEMFGGHAHEKHIPEFLFRGWDIRAIADGFAAGDGHFRHGNEYIITSTSQELILQLWHILISDGQHPYMRLPKQTDGYAPETCKTLYEINWRNDRTTHRNDYTRHDGYYYVMPVQSVEMEDYIGPVHNLEVEGSNSYISNGRASHNCMAWIGCDDTGSEPAFIICNSWGESWVSGPMPEYGIPKGAFLCHADTADRMLKSDGSFAFSSVVGFPPVKLPDYGSKDYL